MEKIKIISYIHSRCCQSHWELIITEESKFELVCEKCGSPSGIEIATEPPPCAKCDECGKVEEEDTVCPKCGNVCDNIKDGLHMSPPICKNCGWSASDESNIIDDEDGETVH